MKLQVYQNAVDAVYQMMLHTLNNFYLKRIL